MLKQKIIHGFQTMFSLDSRSVALSRALIGIVLMCDIVDRFQSWSAFGENSSVSFFPTQLIKENVWQSPWLPSPFLFAPSLSPLLFAIYFVFSFLFALGVGGKGGGEMKRWVSVMCWYLNLSLQQRESPVYYGFDCLTRLTLFYFIFMPVGSSVNRQGGSDKKGDILEDWTLLEGPSGHSKEISVRPRNRKGEEGGEVEESRRREEDLELGERGKSETKQGEGISGGGVSFIIQIILVYFITFQRKRKSGLWTEGSALGYAIQLNGFRGPLAKVVLDFCPTQLLILMTIFALIIEGFGCFLLISPIYPQRCRLLCVFLFCSLHVGIALTMRVGFFPYMSMAGFAAFLPPLFWDSIVPKFSPFYERILKIFSRIFSKFIKEGKGARRGGKKKRRKKNNNFPTFFFYFYHGFPLFCIALSFGYMVHDLTPPSLLPVVHTLRLDQRWMMFAPPPRHSNYFTIVGESPKSSEILLFSDEDIDYQSPFLQHPSSPQEGGWFGIRYDSHRYNNFVKTLRHDEWARKRAHRVACEQWQSVNISQKNVVFVESLFNDPQRHRLSRRRIAVLERRNKEEVGEDREEEREQGVVSMESISFVDYSCPVSSPIPDLVPAPCTKRIIFSGKCEKITRRF